MAGIVNSSDLDLEASDVDLIYAARLLREPPIGGKRKVRQLNEQRAVYAIMGYKHDGLIGMSFMYKAKRVGRS